jgi:hypothetical protein
MFRNNSKRKFGGEGKWGGGGGGGWRGLLWYVYVHLWVPIPFAPKLTNHEENRDSLTSVIVTMDMVEKYMEPKVNAKLKSKPINKSHGTKTLFKIFFLRGGRLVLSANMVRAAGFLNDTMSNCQGGKHLPPIMKGSAPEAHQLNETCEVGFLPEPRTLTSA